MKKIFILIFIMFFNFEFCYADYYVVVNRDGSIHCLEKKLSEVLNNNKKRYFCKGEWPKPFDNEFYYWDGQSLQKRPSIEIKEIVDKRNEKERKFNLEQAIEKLDKLKRLQEIDFNADYSKEISDCELIIETNKK